MISKWAGHPKATAPPVVEGQRSVSQHSTGGTTDDAASLSRRQKRNIKKALVRGAVVSEEGCLSELAATSGAESRSEAKAGCVSSSSGVSERSSSSALPLVTNSMSADVKGGDARSQCVGGFSAMLPGVESEAGVGSSFSGSAVPADGCAPGPNSAMFNLWEYDSLPMQGHNSSSGSIGGAYVSIEDILALPQFLPMCIPVNSSSANLAAEECESLRSELSEASAVQQRQACELSEESSVCAELRTALAASEADQRRLHDELQARARTTSAKQAHSRKVDADQLEVYQKMVAALEDGLSRAEQATADEAELATLQLKVAHEEYRILQNRHDELKASLQRLL